MGIQNETFSKQWMEQYSKETDTCAYESNSTIDVTNRFTWLGCGLGYNMNSFLNSWLHSLIIGKVDNFSVIVGKGMLEELKCHEESSGMVPSGWNCVFDDIPHICVYEPHKHWVTPEQEVMYSPENAREQQRRSVKKDFKRIEENLENLVDVDYMGALSKLVEYLWNHMTPWFRKDVDEYYSSTGTTLALHVRRGDKITTGEARFTHVDVYLKAAVEYLEKESTEMNVDDIRSIYVASDDPSVLYEVRNHSLKFFPNISEESVIFSKDKEKRVTRSKFQGYSSLVELVADLEKLSYSEVFVGTFSSNIGRFVTVLREFRGKKRESSISVDVVNWFPG